MEQQQQPGLINDAQGKQPAPAQAGDVTSGNIPATDDEQRAYEAVQVAGAAIMFSDETHDKVVNMLKSEPSPEQAIADVVVLMVTEIDEQSNNTVPDTVIMKPVEEFIEQVGGMAHEMGIFEVDEAMLNRAAQRALSQLGPMYGMTKQDIQMFIESMDLEVAQGMAQQQAAFGEGTPTAEMQAMQGGADVQGA